MRRQGHSSHLLPTVLLGALAALCVPGARGTRGTEAPESTATALVPDGGPPGSSPPRRPQCRGDGGASLSNCLQRLPAILSNARGIGIPSSKKDLDASCSAFKTGMGCVEEYTRNCLNAKDRRLVEEQVSGANYTFHFLCDDKKFQAEYLQYTSCYRGISREWDSCANRFMELVREEMARRNATEHSRMLELCCAKYGFLRCVYVASLHICRREEAIFLNRIAETLSAIRVYSPMCRNLDMAAVCGAGRGPRAVGAPLLAALLAWAWAGARSLLSAPPRPAMPRHALPCPATGTLRAERLGLVLQKSREQLDSSRSSHRNV